MAPHSRRISNL